MASTVDGNIVDGNIPKDSWCATRVPFPSPRRRGVRGEVLMCGYDGGIYRRNRIGDGEGGV